MKKIICFLYVLVVVIGLSACNIPGFTEDTDMDLTEEDYQDVNSPIPAVSGSATDVVETISIYTVDGIEESLVPLKVPVHTNRITPEFVIDEVLKNIDEKVDVTEIFVEKSRIYIMFNDNYAPIKKCLKKYETLILDCISNSILDNISYIDEVVFRSDSGIYRSDNFVFGAEEVYSSK